MNENKGLQKNCSSNYGYENKTESKWENLGR